TTISDLNSKTSLLLNQTEDLLKTSNELMADINDKVKRLDPLVQAIDDVSESISDINNSSKKAMSNISKFSAKKVGLGIVSSILSHIIVKKHEKNNKKHF
ncbi:MAG: DUF948 domain-containing protein, partial [Lactobacillus iners]|nr:DUF948 domain-containing protein [Lactobacillus iners]